MLNFSGGSADEQGEGLMEASDETVVKTIISANVKANLQGVVQANLCATAVFGILAWEASVNTAVDLDVAVQPSGTVPNPARDFGADWIIRIPMTFTVDNFSIGNIADIFIASRAMRKLPPRTGLLGCFGYEAILAGPDAVLTWTWQYDIRHLFKSGYYSL